MDVIRDQLQSAGITGGVIQRYDADELNTVMFTANITLPIKTTINIMADYRNSPILTLSNALNGFSGLEAFQDYDRELITEFEDRYTEEELKEIAMNRTARSRTYMLGIVQPLSGKLQISADATASKAAAAVSRTCIEPV